MNILGIATTYYPLRGGAETHCHALFSGLANRGHKVVVLTHKIAPESLEREVNGNLLILRIQDFVNHIGEKNRVPWEEALFGPFRDIEQFLGGFHFDIIHTQNQAALYIGSVLKIEFGCPLVASFHETTPEQEPFGKSRSRFCISHFPYDMIIAGSKRFREQAITFGASHSKARLVYFGIPPISDKPAIDPISAKINLGLPQDSIVALSIGRYKPRKRHLEVLSAFTEVFTHIPNLHLCIVGSCNSASEDYYRSVLDAAQASQFSERIWVFRDLPSDTLLQLMKIADIGVLGSEAEGFGLVILEYMQLGIPVIATRIAGATEIVREGYNALTLDSLEDDLSRKIMSLLSNKHLQHHLRKNGFLTIKRFSHRKMIDQTLNIYHKLIGESSAIANQ